MANLIQEITDLYAPGGKKSLDMIKEVRRYDGTADAMTIYKLEGGELSVDATIEALFRSIAEANSVDDPFAYDMASMIRGRVDVDSKTLNVKLVSIKKTFSYFKHRFTYVKGEFKEIGTRVLTLRPAIDVLILDRYVYLLTLNGEKFFNLERAYKNVCREKVAKIGKCNCVSDFDTFSSVANSRHYPRSFLSFRDSNLKYLAERATRDRVADKFRLLLTAEGFFDTSTKENAEKLIKLFCRKGMLDPFDEKPAEVEGAKDWGV